jgi:tyrosine-protein phosphatase YwqE
MSDFYKNTPETILKGLKNLRQELKLQNINIQIDAAAEYYVDYEFEQNIGKEKFLVFGDNYILIELSFFEVPKNLNDIIFKLQLEGYKIILAHPERYLYFGENDYLNLIRRGVFFQLNLLSLIDYYSPRVRKRAEDLIQKEMISFIGSDCHNMKHASLYKKCQNKKSWHNLYNSGKLLNYTL